KLELPKPAPPPPPPPKREVPTVAVPSTLVSVEPKPELPKAAPPPPPPPKRDVSTVAIPSAPLSVEPKPEPPAPVAKPKGEFVPPPPPPPSRAMAEDDDEDDGPIIVDPPRNVQPISKVKPEFPSRLKRLGGGRVKVRITVGTDGLVDKIEVLESEPKRPQDKEGRFDKLVIDAVKKWKFEPYRKPYLVDQEILFKIEDE
ncbi:MAG: TonB family protein, partial [Burkholderiales bacterium]